MILDIADPAVLNAATILREKLKIHPSEILAEKFEEYYNCRIIRNQEDPWALSGHLEFDEEKYKTWFLLQFGGSSE